MNASDIERAFAIWRADLDHFEFPENEAPLIAHMKQRTGWLRAVREATGFSELVLGRRIRLNVASWSQLERREKSGEITLQELESAADALECEFVYFLRPRGRTHFARIAFDQVLSRAQDVLAKRVCPPAMRSHALAVAVKQVYLDPEFRRENGWSRWESFPAMPQRILTGIPPQNSKTRPTS